MKKKQTINKMVGDVPGYLVFVITYLCALLGVTFLGGNFLLMRTPNKTEPYTCTATVNPTDSNISKWMTWVSIVFQSSVANSTLIWSKLGIFLSMVPDWLIFYGLSIILMLVIPVIIYPLSVALIIYASFQTCPGFKESIHYAIPPVYFYEWCNKKDEVWDYDNLGMTFLFKIIPWMFHMMFHLCQSFFFLVLNVMIWSLGASVNSMLILWGLFVSPFFKTREIFHIMGGYTASLSILILFIVLYGAFKYLSIYVFIGFCMAALVILSREAIAELAKPNN
jgi:hypothetical protein